MTVSYQVGLFLTWPIICKHEVPVTKIQRIHNAQTINMLPYKSCAVSKPITTKIRNFKRQSYSSYKQFNIYTYVC